MLDQRELIGFIADTLRQARQRKNFTLDKLAEKSDTDYSTVSLIENGRQNPKIYTMYKLLYALDIDIAALLTEESRKVRDRKAAILNRLEKLDTATLECIDEFLDNFHISKKL